MDDVTPSSDSRYRSGTIEIDASQRRVLIDDVPAKIGARAFDVLMALLERRERVVPKRELMELVWPKLVVEENNLLVHMVALRKLLGPQAIVTIPGRGYRFVMPVDVVRSGKSPASMPASGLQAPAKPPVKGNLPPPLDLFGRAQDLSAIDALLNEQPVLSIVGAGGIGKTRLAQAAAAAVRIAFPDGRWWVELAPIAEGSQLPPSIAGTIGLQLASSRETMGALVTALSGQSLLLVLDGCEHVAEEVASLVDELRARAPNVRVLVTSQESLKCRDEQVYRLGALAIPATAQLEEAAQFGAVALFVERAHAVEPRFRLADDNVAAVIDICRRLDGIPLAIELAAARVPLLGVHGLHARLDQMFNVLTGGARMKLRRHQTLRAALEWSHGLLSADEQIAFRRVGVFAGGFTLELAQRAVSDERIDPWLVLELLGNLIDKSLVIADGSGEPRYRLLETTRAFALEQLAAAGESAAMLRRHAQVICELMAATDANCWNLSPAERRRAVQELGNLRAAVDWAVSSGGDRTLAYTLLSKCWLVWMHNSLTSEGVRRMLPLWPPAPDLPEALQADFCLALSRLHEEAGRDEEWQAARRAMGLYRRLGEVDRLGDAVLLFAAIGFLRGELQEAATALHEAEQLITPAAALRKQAALAATQGMFHKLSGTPERAIAAYRQQGELYRQAGAELGVYLALGNVGAAQLDAGEIDAAIESLRQSVDGLRRLNAPYGHEMRITKLALAMALRGDDLDVIPLVRGVFEHLRSMGITHTSMMAAALQHARRNRLHRAALLAGYAKHARARKREPICLGDDQALQQVQGRAEAKYSAEAVESWFIAGERLTEAQAAAIAFDEAPLDDPP